MQGHDASLQCKDTMQGHIARPLQGHTARPHCKSTMQGHNATPQLKSQCKAIMLAMILAIMLATMHDLF